MVDDVIYITQHLLTLRALLNSASQGTPESGYSCSEWVRSDCAEHVEHPTPTNYLNSTSFPIFPFKADEDYSLSSPLILREGNSALRQTPARGEAVNN